MNLENLKEVIRKHTLWINGHQEGERANLREANLSEADLSGANLRGADLREANLSGADLIGADLRGADLIGADLSMANLRGANLSGADLRGANLSGADLREADLREANLSGADLIGADLRGANLSEVNLSEANLIGANLSEADLSGANLRGADLIGADLSMAKNVEDVIWNIYTTFYPLQCPEAGAYTAYKKAQGLIVELQIPPDALRTSATSRKCRASKAKVISITDVDGKPAGESVASDRDSSFLYVVGETVEVKDFDTNRWRECAPGIHHYITRAEAVKHT